MKIKFKNNPNNTLYIYCRVSTGGQEKGGVSLDVQEERGIKFCKSIGMSPYIIKEQGSGLKPCSDERPIFSELLDGIEDGVVKNVWIDEDTRLTRLDTDQQYIHITMKKQDVNLYVGSSTVPKKWDWITDLVDTLITKVNQEQIRTQVRKSIRSKRRLFSEGKYMKGDPPFGYKLKDKCLVPREDTKDWVEKIYRMYDDGKTTPQIQNELLINNVPPPRFKLTNHMVFDSNTIINILTNKNYIGIDTYGDLTNTCPQLVDKKLFDSVQVRVSLKRGQKSNVKHDGLLKGIIKCGDGTPMKVEGIKKSRKNPLYSCGHRQRVYKKRCEHTDCNITKSLRQIETDEIIWNHFIDVWKDSKIIRQKTKEELIGYRSRYSIRSIKGKIKRLTKDLNSLHDRRLELDKKYYSNEMVKETYEILCKSNTEKSNELTDKISRENFKIDSIREKERWIDWLDEHFKRGENLREMSSMKERKKVLSEYIHEIRCLDYSEESKQHKLNIGFRIPIINDKIVYSKNKDGSVSRDKKGRKKYEIKEGVDSLNNPLTLHKLLHCNGLR